MKSPLRNELTLMAEPEYQKFSSKLLPGTKNILGVRIPKLRLLAKNIAKEDWKTYLSEASDDTFEEIMLQGMVIGYADMEINERLKLIEGFVPKIDNWSVCDSFCAGLSITKTHPEEVWKFLTPYLSSGKPYEIRFGVVMYLMYFIDEKHINTILKTFDKISHEEYYVKMAVAWGISICFVKFPKETMSYLKRNRLDDFTYNKSLQKIIESNRVNDETKDQIRLMKRKKRQNG